MKKMHAFFKLLIGMLFLFLSIFIPDVGAQKIPIAISDFSTDMQGWITHDLSNAQTYGSSTASWYWYNGTYDGTTGFARIVPPTGWGLRNSWLISPVIDLANVTEAEFYLTFVHRYGTKEANKMLFYAQDADSIDINKSVDADFIAQWGSAVKLNLSQEENAAQLGIPNTNPTYDVLKLHTTSAQNLSMFDGKKIRFGIHFYNVTSNSAANSKNLYFKLVQVAGTINDVVAPVIDVPKIDSVGNTFARGYLLTDGITKVNWGVSPKGQPAPNMTALIQNTGTSAFSASGVVQVNAGGREVMFNIKGLTVNTEYTLFYGGTDFSNNVSGVKSIDFTTGNDLVAPVIQSIVATNLNNTSVIPEVVADETGTLVCRLYSAGREPQTLVEFNAGTNNVRTTTIKYDTIGLAKKILFEALVPNTPYIVYATVTDFTGNVSKIFKSEAFTTPADVTAPVITSINATEIGNHGGKLNLTVSEPAAGYGNVYAYWAATAKGATLSKEDVISRKGALASGVSAKLDSATKANVIPLDNLEKGTEYTIQVVAQDASLNISEVSTVNITTTSALESSLIFLQDFNLINQNYHFLDVVIPAGKTGWESAPTSSESGDVGAVLAKNWNTTSTEPAQDSWCMIGPIDMTGKVDITAELLYRATYGAYKDHLQMWISKGYKAGDTFTIDNWTKISEDNDVPADNLTHTINKAVPVGFDTAGVYIGVRFLHTRYNHNFRVGRLKMFGKSIGTAPAPVIDYVEGVPTSSTTAQVTFAANDYGRGFYYLVKDNGETPQSPTMAQVVGGDGAAVSGYYEYTAGSNSDQKFNITGLEPNTKYHLFTGFRDLIYTKANSVYYDAATTIIQTPALELLSLKDTVIYATNTTPMATASTPGKIYWTVKGATDVAPATNIDIISSFSSRGSLNYTSILQEEANWTISNLKPDSSYVCYAILTDADAKYASTIQSFAFSTPKLEVLTAQYDSAVVSDSVNMTYKIPFKATASSNGKLYVLLTDLDAPQPMLDSVLVGKSGFASGSFTVTTPKNIIMEVSKLTEAQSKSFNAWLVLESGIYYSEMFKLSTSPTLVRNLAENSDFELWSSNRNVVLNIKKATNKNIRIMDIAGRTLIEKRVNLGQNQIGQFKAGVYLVMVQIDNQTYTKKVIVK